MNRRMSLKRPIERPVVGFILSLIGGLFIVAGAIYGLITFASYYGGYYSGYPGPYLIFSILGLVTGIGVLLGSLLVYLVPRQRVAWGVVIIVLGVASLFDLSSGFFGGFFIGMALSIVGGSLAIAWKPSAVLGFEDYRTCLSCGRHVRAEYPVCPFCGTRATIATPGPGATPPTSPP